MGVTNSSGALYRNTYEEYGAFGPSNGGRFSFTGQIVIPELALLHYKARTYNPALGRFLQTDPVGYEDDLNLYQYAYNDPLNVTDPTGMDGACTYTTDACGMKTTDPARVAAQVNAGKGMTVAVAAVAVAAMVEVAGPAVAGKVVESAAKQGSAEGAKSSASMTPAGPERPSGVPKNFDVSPTAKGGGTKYTDPANPHNSVRDMPGNPNSPNPAQQNPYVRENVSGQPIDKAGRPVDGRSPGAHIPRDEYQYRGRITVDE